jgi:hypothetical protein
MEDLEHGDSDTDDTDYDCNNQIDGSQLVCSLNQPGTGLIQLTNAIYQLRRQPWEQNAQFNSNLSSSPHCA